MGVRLRVTKVRIELQRIPEEATPVVRITEALSNGALKVLQRVQEAFGARGSALDYCSKRLLVTGLASIVSGVILHRANTKSSPLTNASLL